MGQRVLTTEIDAQTVRLEHFCELLDRMFKRPGMHQQGSAQHTLLLASILKVKQTARGVELLAGAECVEEIQALSRSLVEVTVNAAYLQRAGFEEVQRFMQFQPERLYSNAALLGDGRSGGLAAGVLGKLKGLMLQRAAPAHRENGDPTWTGRTLRERAEIADANSGAPVMKLLMDRVYPKGHAALHGTMDSLEPFIAALDQSGRRGQPDRHAAKVEALFSVNLCLFTLCIYLNQAFRLRMDTMIEDAAQAYTPLSELRGVVQGEGGRTLREA